MQGDVVAFGADEIKLAPVGVNEGGDERLQDVENLVARRHFEGGRGSGGASA